jgi:hypothetical protein
MIPHKKTTAGFKKKFAEFTKTVVIQDIGEPAVHVVHDIQDGFSLTLDSKHSKFEI